MTTAARKWIDENCEHVLVMDGYDDCIIGVARRFTDTFVIYDYKKVIEKLMSDGMSEDDAIEFWEFNQVGGWMWDKTPGFLFTPGTHGL